MRASEADGDDLKYPEWQRPLREAMLEFDKDKLKGRVAAAEKAIFDRQQGISQSPERQAERQAIEDALALLRILKRDRLGLPDWGRSE